MVHQASELRIELRKTRDADARSVLTLRIEGLLRDARVHLGRAYERDHSNIEVVRPLVNVCRALADVDATEHWSSKLAALKLQ